MSEASANAVLAYSIDGPQDAPPVVMGSSLGTTREMWAPNLAALSEFRVIRYDHLGHGESEVPPRPYTMEQLAAGVLHLLDSLGIDKAAYVGLSLGGAVGQWLAINAPERISSLALLCTAAQFPPPESWLERAELVRAEGTGAFAETAMGRWFTEGFRERHPEQIQQWMSMVKGVPDEGYAGCCEALATYDVRQQLGTIAAPTLALAGADDPSTGPDDLRFIADRIPGARLEVVDDAAHLANVEQADAVNRLLVEHLRDGGR